MATVTRLTKTYQIAHDYFAITGGSGPLGPSDLRSPSTGGLRCLLDTADGRSSRGSSGSASLRSATAATLAGIREDLVKGLVDLARHVC